MRLVNQKDNKILEQLSKILLKYNVKIEFIDEIVLEIPNDLNNGDLTSNIALKYCKKANMSAKALAEVIINEFDYDEANIISITVAGPGFLNFKYSNKMHNEVLKKIHNLQFKKIVNPEPLSINVEFVSANPTGLLHIGHARNAIFGDVLINLLKRVGHNVVSEYYINDAGVQMNNLGLSVKARYLELLGEPLIIPENGYFGNEIILIAEQLKIAFNDSKKDADNNFFTAYGYQANLKQITENLKSLGVEIEKYFSEISLYENQKIAVTLESLAQLNVTYEKDGAL